jgi:L-malate glycosyltransferase
MNPSRKTRILYVNHTGNMSGAEKVLVEILRGLDYDRYEPVVICPSQGGLAEEVLQLGVEQHPLQAVNTRFARRPDQLLRSIAPIFKAVIGLRKKIRILAPDVIHANSVRAGIVATLAATGTGKAVIWHVHDTLPKHPGSSAIRLLALMARRTRVIAVSQAAAQRFCGSLPLAKKVQTIHNGVDLSRFPVKQEGGSPFRESIGVSRQDFLVCAIGQICARKGLLELIDAIGQICKRAPHVHLAIVGRVVFQHEAEYLEALHAAAAAAGVEDRVHFTGELHNVSPVLQGADLLVLNSRDEPFGLVLIEAMASGTPVLATRVGGIPEIISDSENGWLVEKGDTAGLASKLLELSRDREELLHTAYRAYCTTVKKFSIERFQQDLSQYYTALGCNPNLTSNNRHVLAKSVTD